MIRVLGPKQAGGSAPQQANLLVGTSASQSRPPAPPPSREQVPSRELITSHGCRSPAMAGICQRAESCEY